MSVSPPLSPNRENHTDSNITAWTDSYFNRTKEIIKANGDCIVTYAFFMRRPVICAPKLMLDWLKETASNRNIKIEIEQLAPEASWVGAGEPMLYITGSFLHLVDLETLLLQKLGPACVAAYHAGHMCMDLPNTGFLAMDARHCAGLEMAEMMAYAAAVGTQYAKNEYEKQKHDGESAAAPTGFIGNATNATAHYFGNDHGFGTMPHALIGYAGSTLEAAKLFCATHQGQPLTVLVDYFGQEITDALAVCHYFKDMAASGQLSVRLDTQGSRYLEGLDPAASYAVLDRNSPRSIRGFRTESELNYLIGSGVSAAAIWQMRTALDDAGFQRVKIVASSGFGPEKCKVMALANAPINVVGTGSF
ncbi:MAG: nicotinate phosphoribosyltransferase, partial [Alphaproteobacteria bacterium]